MGAGAWIAQHWLELFQPVNSVGLLFTAYTIHKDAKVRQVSNHLAIVHEHREIWNKAHEHPELFRILQHDVDLDQQPISNEERIFVRDLVLHLDSVYRAMKAGMTVNLEGAQNDIKAFFSKPITKSVWAQLKPFQDTSFVRFVDAQSWGPAES